MFFRAPFKLSHRWVPMWVGFIAGVFALICGCGLHLGEEAVPKKEIRIGQEACMGHIDQMIYRYAHADLSASETDEFFLCLQKSIRSFQTYVRGDHRDSYSPPELRQFFEINLVPDRKISDELLRQLMILKATFAGGTPEVLTRSELNRTLEIVEIVRQLALVMRPYIMALNPSIALRSEPDENIPPLDESVQALKNAADILGRLMADINRPYLFKNIESLVIEWRHFSRSDGPSDISAHQWINLWQSFNSFAGGHAGDSIESDEWPLVLYQMAGWYSLWVRFKYVLHEPDIFHKSSTDGVRAFLDEFVDLMGRILKRDGAKPIEYAKLDRVILDLADMQLLPADVRASSVSRVARILFSKMLGSPEINPKDRPFEAIDLGAIQRLRSEVAEWSNSQNMLINTFYNRPSEHSLLAQKWFRLSVDRQVLDPFSLAQSLMPDVVSDDFGVGDFLNLTKNLRPLFRQFNIGDTKTFRVYFVGDAELVKQDLPKTKEVLGFSYYDLSWINFLHTVVRFLFKGYAEDSQRRTDLSGVTQDEVQSFYEDLKPLGEDLHIFDRRKKGAGSRSFLEGKLFTYNSDGYELKDTESNAHYLSFPQGVEMLGFLISGGMAGRRLYNLLSRPGFCQPDKNAGVDIFRDPLLDTECSMHHLVSIISDQVPNMPFWQRYFNTLSYDEKFGYLSILLDAVKDHGPLVDPNTLEKSDLVALSVFLQYIEAVFTRFDENQDDYLKLYELEKAFPVYKGMIEYIGRVVKCLDMDAKKDHFAFMYLLKFNEIPNTGFNSAGLDTGATWILHSIVGWGMKMTRMDLAKTFRVIAQAMLDSDRRGQQNCRKPELPAPPEVPSESITPMAAPNLPWSRVK